ncbi:MAG: RimK family alpha-L-glutamate ligase [Proteobacteria bacterium]|jgi:ribosomal protein S6--L-glutamate ligase|nr:RimK family alpha-L-glutamate ligase [Pseudomonadota bacterium]
MKLLILSSTDQADSTKDFKTWARKHKVNLQVLDPRTLSLQIKKSPQILFHRKTIEADLVLPRLGLLSFESGLRVAHHFEAQGVTVMNSTASLRQCSLKFEALQTLASHGIPVPESYWPSEQESSQATWDQFETKDLIQKLNHSSQGFGLGRTQNKEDFLAWRDFQRTTKASSFVQAFASETKGQDVRVFVCHGEILGAMLRTPGAGSFRSNLHQGGKMSKAKLSVKEIEVALQSTQIFGLQYAGIDLLRTRRGPKVLEVNPSPGWQGLKRLYDLDILSRLLNPYV